MFYDTLREYEFEEALRDEERFSDWDEGEAVNRPQDDADDWESYCLTEEAHKEMLERAAKEYHESLERLRRTYGNDIQIRHF